MAGRRHSPSGEPRRNRSQWPPTAGPSTSTEPGLASRRLHMEVPTTHRVVPHLVELEPCMLLSFERPLSDESRRAHLSAALENCTAATCPDRSNAIWAY